MVDDILIPRVISALQHSLYNDGTSENVNITSSSSKGQHTQEDNEN